MHRGTVVQFSAEKGFGFIRSEERRDDLFCHFSAIRAEGYKKLEVGDEVTFDVELGPKGKPQATNVVVVKPAVVEVRR